MTDLINGRTPEEIKRWVDSRVRCDDCPNEHEVGCEPEERTKDCQMCIDTIAYIEQLEVALKCEQVARTVMMEEAPKWIKVEDALPESGVHVLVCCKRIGLMGYETKYICDGFYAGKHKVKAGWYDEDSEVEYSEEDDEYYFVEGWYEVIKNWGDYDSVVIDDRPTHWMRQPEPPEEDTHG